MGKKIIELKNIVKSFDDEVVVRDLNLYVNENEFITLVGPSGCGKTTTLRMIGGFEDPDSGEIVLNGEIVNNIPAYQRPINTVFQRYALFPHLNVFDNVAFGLRNYNRIFEELKSEVRKRYESERKTLLTQLNSKSTTQEEKAEIKYRLKEIKKEIKEQIIEEKENLVASRLEDVEKRYTKKITDLEERIAALEEAVDEDAVEEAKEQLYELEAKVKEEAKNKFNKQKVYDKYKNKLNELRKVAHSLDIKELEDELKTANIHYAEEIKSAKSLMLS